MSCEWKRQKTAWIWDGLIVSSRHPSSRRKTDTPPGYVPRIINSLRAYNLQEIFSPCSLLTPWFFHGRTGRHRALLLGLRGVRYVILRMPSTNFILKKRLSLLPKSTVRSAYWREVRIRPFEHSRLLEWWIGLLKRWVW